MNLDAAVREAMLKCAEANGTPVEITYKLADIPWKITLEIDEEKITKSEGEKP